MRKFYILFKVENVNALRSHLSWTHYRELLKKNINEINYYINLFIEQNLSYRQLSLKIKNKEYERLPNNTKNKLITNEEKLNVQDLVKNPIVIKNTHNYEVINEKILKQLILEDISSFMKELGSGFCFIDSEYKIKIGNTYNYIDLLLYNIKFKCYAVVELKVTVLKKEHIGQIQVYMNYVDDNIKSIEENKTIGIIIVKKENKFVLEYSSDKRIFETEYVLN